MRTLLWLLLLGPVLLLLALFGLSNRQEVLLRLWPFDPVLAAPLSLAVFVVATLSFLLGAGVAWVAAWEHRRRARRLEDATRLLEAELTDLRGRAAREVAPPPAHRTTLPALPRLARSNA